MPPESTYMKNKRKMAQMEAENERLRQENAELQRQGGAAAQAEGGGGSSVRGKQEEVWSMYRQVCAKIVSLKAEHATQGGYV